MARMLPSLAVAVALVTDARLGRAEVPGIQETAPPAEAGRRSKRLSFHFESAPWKLVLDLFAKEAGLSLDMDDVPPGGFTYRDSKSYTPTEALDVLNGYLLKRGFLLVRRDRFLVVLNIDNPIPPNLIPQVTVDELPQRGRYELMSVVLPLGDINAKAAAAEIKEMLGPQGKSIPLAATNRLLVTDIGENLQIIQRALAEVGAAVDGRSQTFRAFKLLHVSATEAERGIRELFGLSPRSQRGAAATKNSSQQDADRQNNRGRRGGFSSVRVLANSAAGGDGWGAGFPWDGGLAWDADDYFQGRGRDRSGRDRGEGERDGHNNKLSWSSPSARLLLAADSRTNTLMVTCSVDDMKLVDQVIKSLDVKPAPGERESALRGKDAPFLKPYTIESADPQVVMDMLHMALPGIVMYYDPKARRINVYASAAEHEQVEPLFQELDGGADEQVKVVPLNRLEPLAAAATLRALFASGNKVDPPSIEADATGRRLLIRGSPDQISQIMKLLTDMGEISRGSRDALSASSPDRTKWTVYSCQLTDATELAAMLGNLFPEGIVTRTTQQQSGFASFALRANLNDDSGLGTLRRSGALRIVPHVERNTLYITGSDELVAQVMEAIEVLDSADLPQALKDRVPRMIPVEHAEVEDVAEIVRDVYKEQMEGGGRRSNPQQDGSGGAPNPFNMFANFGQQNQPQGRPARAVQLSIGIDMRTNRLIVSASEPLFRQVQELVRSLDESARQARRTVRVVSLQNANSAVVQETLVSLMGRVKTNGSRGRKATPAAPSTKQNQDRNQTQLAQPAHTNSREQSSR